MDDPKHEPAGTPVGRRTILGVLGLGVAGVLGGSWAQNGLAACSVRSSIATPPV